MDGSLVPRSLVRATELDVLAPDHVVERRGDVLVVRSPSNPAYYWGNYLLFPRPPGPGDGPRWEALFDEAFAAEPRVRHRALGWDTTDGDLGAAHEELVARGYDLQELVGLIAVPDALTPRAGESRTVEVRALDPDADEDLWDGVVELQVAGRDEAFRDTEDDYRAFSRARLADQRRLFREGRGAWYVALLPGTREVAGSLGIVVTGGRGRYQAVDTAEAHRRQGICSRLVVEAARHAVATFGAETLVICAEPDYHALGLYESLGFERRERVAGAHLMPPADAAAA